MAEEPRERDEGAAHLGDLERASKIPAKQRTIKTSSLVDKVCLQANDEGLPNASLNKLVDIITLPNELDQASLATLIRNLYPSSKVPDAIVIKVVSSLGHGRAKPSHAVQAALLRWLVLVYDVLENQRLLSQLYSTLFNLLDTIAIRPQLCHVLCLITQRKHVRPFRIQALMELTRQAGNEPPLVGLMRVYKDYYPDVIVGEATAGRASHPDPEWRQRLREIQEQHFQRTQDGLAPEKHAFRVTRKGINAMPQGKSSIVPEVHTSHAQESSVTLEEIEDVHNFVQKLEKIEPPNQLVAVIGDSLLQKFLQLRSSESSSRRVDAWLLAFFEDQLEVPESAESKILEMLEAVLIYTRYTKKLPPACLRYLNSMFYLWNGITGREVILALLAYTPLDSFTDLYASTFQSMEEAVLDDATLESKLALLTFYKNLLDQWTASLLSEPRPPASVTEAIVSLVHHSNNLALTIVQTSLKVKTFSTILSFYESTASLITHTSLKPTVRITIPPAELVYTLHFTNSLSTISRLCSILTLYKKAFEIAMAPKSISSSATDQQSYHKDYVNHFNGFLMDVCNCVWRSRALNTSDPNALGCLLFPPVTLALNKYITALDNALSLASIFSFSFSPIFCLLSISYIRELEDNAHDDIERRHAGPVTQSSLKTLEKDGGLTLSWPEYKLGVLHYMENNGVNGVAELMYNTMKHLMTARDNKP